MSDNVIILGAGFSHDSGIPLLGGTVERMLEFASRRTHNGKALSTQDVEIFEAAIKVRNELDGYHGRAQFDDRNIEDILSILSFNALAGGKREYDKLEAITRALARTIELSCSVTHPGVSVYQNLAQQEGPEQYRAFWMSLFRWKQKGNSIPTIITFNYDLVLERALLQILINHRYFDGWKSKVPFSSIQIKYFSDQVPDPAYKVDYVNYNGPDFEQHSGTVLVPIHGESQQNILAIEILKLHGSLNFPEKAFKGVRTDFNIAASVDAPYILPPIFNKLSANKSVKAWATAMQRLRTAKNLTIVGYSLPRTDIYMQYFLKTSLGPNLDLNKITVFDPILFQDGANVRDMESRYEECFSPQLQRRIVFRPELKVPKGYISGSAAHFIHVLSHEPQSIFF